MREIAFNELSAVSGGSRVIDEFRIIAQDGIDITPQVVTIIGMPWTWAANGAAMLSVIGTGSFFLGSYGAVGITANSLLAVAGLSGVVGGALGLLGYALAGIYITARDSTPSGDPNVSYP